MITKAEAITMDRLDSGFFSINDKGEIFRHFVMTRAQKLRPVKSRRAENTSGNGYLFIPISINGKLKKAMAHRIVWMWLNGAIPDGMEMNHLDGIKDNNHPDNLEVCTRSQNMKHAFRQGFVKLPGGIGENHMFARLREKEVLRIRKIHKSGLLSMTELGRMFNVHVTTIKRVVDRATWKHM